MYPTQSPFAVAAAVLAFVVALAGCSDGPTGAGDEDPVATPIVIAAAGDIAVDWQFVPVSGATFADERSANCVDTGSP